MFPVVPRAISRIYLVLHVSIDYRSYDGWSTIIMSAGVVSLSFAGGAEFAVWEWGSRRCLLSELNAKLSTTFRIGQFVFK